MTFQCKTFPNENAANGAINAAEATWDPPVYVDVGVGRHAPHFGEILPTVAQVP